MQNVNDYLVLKNVLFIHHVLNIVEKSMYNTLYFVKLKHKSDTLQNKSKAKFSDAGIQDVSTRISIKVRTQKNINDLTERYEPDDDDDDDDESDKHLEARDRRYSCLIFLS